VSLVALLHLSFAGAEPSHLPLMRRSAILRADDYAAAANHMRYKYGFEPDSTISKRQESSALTSSGAGTGGGPMAAAQVGDPQSLNFVLDTGTSDFWVPGIGCESCTPDTPTFNFSASNTFTTVKDPDTGKPKDISINYGSDTIDGFLVQDILAIGSFQVLHQSFVLVNTFTPGFISGSTAGILGLGFSTLAVTQSTPFWQTLAAGGGLPKPEMSFFIARPPKDSNTSKEAPAGVFTFGGQNKTFFKGDVEFLPLVTISGKLTFWMLPFASVTVDGKCIDLPLGNVAIIDTNSPLIGGPCDEVAEIYAQIPGSKKLPDLPGHYGFPCESRVEISVSFGGQSWPINPEDINLGPVPDCPDICLGAIFDMAPGQKPNGIATWIFGDAFLKNVYSVFRLDPPSLGFAKLADCED